eukprot:g8360.t1
MKTLQGIYCGTLGIELAHLADEEERRWLQEAVEKRDPAALRDPGRQKGILTDLMRAEQFEKFCALKWPAVKRFGLEGGESLIPALLQGFDLLGTFKKTRTILLGGFHRGRLNLIAHVLGVPYAHLFAQIGEVASSDTPPFSFVGDVKYHLGICHALKRGKRVFQVELLANPSHLQSVAPVVMGKMRAYQDANPKEDVLGILIHGDAAFAAQGVAYEGLQLSRLEGYGVRGNLHIVINNQVGFTTNPRSAHSGISCTDLARVTQAPILHVNGDDVEEVIDAVEIALRFRFEFKRDVVVNLVCYRRHGHNETDEPAFTQPLMYKTIKQHPVTSQRYGARCLQDGSLSQKHIDEIKTSVRHELDQAYQQSTQVEPLQSSQFRSQGLTVATVKKTTAVAQDVLKTIGTSLTCLPRSFTPHPKVVTFCERRREMIQGKRPLDWSMAEALALGSLLTEGFHVRLSGQDSGRGTFTQRHAILWDQEDNTPYIPLQHLQEKGGRCAILNSPLSEMGVLGFEYGYTLQDPQALVLWEAQFGDFANGAQVMIDQYIASGEAKWGQTSRLVMLLPHGYEGQGAEHSSARLERYLQLCAQDNLRVANCSTPASYFHLLRDQMLNERSRPLILMTPKSLLRHREAVSSLGDLTKGTFVPVLPDPEIKQPNRVVLCSGKVYYDLLAVRQEKDLKGVAIVRLEQLYPFPEKALVDLLKPYAKANLVWCQEEPENNGAWPFLERKLHVLAHTCGLEGPLYAGRPESAAPATGLGVCIMTKEKPHTILVPEMGESLTEATIGPWLVGEGDEVKEDQTLVELETEKITLEVPAPVSGILHKILKEKGTIVSVGEEIGNILPGDITSKKGDEGREADQVQVSPLIPSQSQNKPPVVDNPPPMPSAKKLMQEHDISPADLDGTGKDGRITKGDVLEALETEGSKESIQKQAPRQEERVPLSPLRKAVATHLKAAQNTAALLTTFNEIDMRAVIEVRARLRPVFEETYDVKLGFMSFFVRACTVALHEMPVINAEIQGEEIVYKNYYDIGVAVSTDHGLVVPVLKDAHRQTFAEIEKNLADLAQRARTNKITLDELRGGTFSITNGGVFGSLLSTPIVNAPQSAILGMHAIQRRPVVREEQITIRPMMQACSSLKNHGIEITQPVLNLDHMMARKNKGQAILRGSRDVEVTHKGKRETWTAKRAIILATGSAPTPFPGVDIDEERILSSTGGLELSSVPSRLLVLGGGYIGLELGSVWQRLGAQVNIMDRIDPILPQMDGDIAKTLYHGLSHQGLEFKLGQAVQSIEQLDHGVKVHLSDEVIEGDALLLALGRRPCTDGLGLEELGIQTHPNGAIVVNKTFETTCAGVYAIGDVIPGPMLAHKGEEEGIALAEFLSGQAIPEDPVFIPSVIYTHPMVASVGLTEGEARQQGLPIKTGRFSFQANARAKAMGEEEGFIKVIAHAQTDRILGVHMIGLEVDALIAEATMAMQFGAASEDIARICHAHPTSSEALREACLRIISPAGMYVSRQIHGVNVLGTLEDIEEILGKLSARKQPPDYLIIADQIFQGQKLFEFLALVERLGLRVGQLPNTTELISPLEKMRIRSLSVEDLLGRPQTTLDLHSMFSLLKGKRVLITGVGGSIGRELMRQIAEFSPAHMVLLDHSEMLLYQAASDLQEKHPYLSHRLLMIDVREKERIQQVMAEEKPEFVFHAAALKHVPLVESHPVEGVFTNLLGTRYIADACIANKVSVMVLISTDKAIRPTSIMGMTKRLAEAYCQSVDVMDQGRKSHGTHFTTVRFGNVLGSTGSVVPLFRRQIERGGPVTVTHPKMMRYFMSVQEAVQLLLQATVLGASSIIKRGRVFVLDMGDPLSILELAENMIRLSDLRPYEDIKIEFTGLRPGEKLYEELFDENEEMLKTDNPAILTASPQFSNHKILSEALDKLEIAVAEHDQQACVDLLRSLLPDSERESAQDQQEKGTLESFQGRFQMAHPRQWHARLDALTLRETIYPVTEGLRISWLETWIRQALGEVPFDAEDDWLSPAFLRERGWPSWKDALWQLHTPQNEGDLLPSAPALQRLAYDEALADQFALALAKAQRQSSRATFRVPCDASCRLAAPISENFGHQLTSSQIRVLHEIRQDLSKTVPMMRLLHGDVGSGKTIVALLAVAGILEQGGQVAFLAPTEVLASQHAKTFEDMLRGTGIKVLLVKRGDSRQVAVQDAVRKGDASLIVGTHAVLESSIQFHCLGMVVVDEQHRFGIAQRLALLEKGALYPHLLSMSATPIPRTFELGMLGDMAVSRLAEKPAGRVPPQTCLFSLERLDEIIASILSKSAQGEQVYWVCPLVEETQKQDLSAALERYESLRQELPGQVGLLHGRLKSQEKETVLRRFKAKELQILVATTVIEVGVDVPDACIMVIEHAERFGLAQLHQLRGRVGRGQRASYCFLLYTPPLSFVARKRLEVMKQSHDGFFIAEQDWKLRGGGDRVGLRQSGRVTFVFLDLEAHVTLFQQAHQTVKSILKEDPELQNTLHRPYDALMAIFDKVKWFNLQKGYGFLEPFDGTADVFVHFSVLEQAGYYHVCSGDEVVCEIGRGNKGLQAMKVYSVVSEANEEGEQKAPPPASSFSFEENHGVVKWFNVLKGYGFVQPDDGGRDVFIHTALLQRSGIDRLPPGCPVRVRVFSTERGREAQEIFVDDLDHIKAIEEQDSEE